MLRNTSLAALFLSLVVGCASSNNTNTAATDDTGTTEDTAPAEDTAPWNTYPPPGELHDATGNVLKDSSGNPKMGYGLNRLDIYPNVKIQGYRDGVGEWTDLSMQDYFDPTGERGVYAILVIVSAEWCGPCKEEAKVLPGFYTSTYKPRGAKFLTAMIENASGKPADKAVVDRWIKAYGTNFDIGADPEGSTMLPKSDPKWGIPRNYIIDPRTMKIARVNSGTNPDATNIPGLKVMLDYNNAPAAP